MVLFQSKFLPLSVHLANLFLRTDLTSPTALEDEFCKNFHCCGLQLNDMHELLKHSEECHYNQAESGRDQPRGLEMIGDQVGEEDLPFPLDLQNFDELEVDLLDRSKSPFTFVNAMQSPVQQKTLSMQDIYCDTVMLERPPIKYPAVPFQGRQFIPRQNTWFPPRAPESIRSPATPHGQQQQPQHHPQKTHPMPSRLHPDLNIEYEDPAPRPTPRSKYNEKEKEVIRPSQRISGDRHCNTCRSRKTSKWYKDHVDVGKYICKTCYNQIYKERNK